MTVLVENIQDKIEINEHIHSIIERAVELCLESEAFDLPSETSIVLMDDHAIQDINREQRNVNKPTDVLSFPMLHMHNGKALENGFDTDPDTNLILLGDIVISMETAARQAEEYGHSFERELAFLTTHGMLHLLGYDHESGEEEVMFQRQEAVLARMGLDRRK
ncbi:putative rRNA maturation factor [Anaerobacterium chartisolvens]|uniref:Endoribonuclease YbeY n=1 Tax=Anaerobacterium chartisolvens TaxID=1297424 RepID=A0A369AZT6_9FIRM|nr:rRNA maturation RNase YbeY [Anaerobacterium chartisolvens]RCX13848.1 putative rRNA maturation factor [Anaerobacterium chartisolvens]